VKPDIQRIYICRRSPLIGDKFLFKNNYDYKTEISV